MAIIKKFGDALSQTLNSFRTFITDTNPNSEYFRVTEFKETFTGGKNGFLIEGSQYLKESTEIKIQILDVNGEPIYYEPASGTPEYYEGVSTLVAVYVYEDTPIGLANITILGELKQYVDDDGIERDVPDEWKGIYNVKWERSFKVNRLIRNEDRVRFYRRPDVEITEIVKPIFSNVVSTITKSGSLNGIPLNPIAGTKIADFTLPTSYLLKLNDGSAWTGSVVGNGIQIPTLNYNPTATDVLNNTELVVKNPFTINGIVSSFISASFTASFNYVEGVDNLATALTGSFAKIKLTQLSTFVGDVARVKVYRKSQSDLSDYQFIQEIQLESNEILIDLESQTKNQEFYGLFDSNIITEYWATSSNNITPSFNQSILFNSAKLTNSGTNFYFTSKSLDITKDIEYTLDLNLRRESVQNNQYLKVFLSGSRQSNVNGSPATIQIQQNIINVSADNSTLQKINSSTNFVAEEIDNAKLYFEVNGGPWYISDVSVRASQESSFSPDELTFIQPVPRTLPEETFDFLFQFYDINNNYIPIVVEESKTFNGGNLNAINKSIELIPSSLYFQFDSGSNGGNPVPPTTIFIDVVKNFLTGSTNFTSRSFDFFNNELSSSQYVGGVFPGLLEDFNLDTVTLTVQAFTGSVAPPNPDIIVQFIQYTAECEGVEDSIIITRVQDGKGGVNYEIRAYNGTVIRNSDISSSLEIQAIRIDGVNEIKLKSGLEDNRSDFKLHIQSASTYITLTEASSSGFVKGLRAGTTGSGELNYNALFTRDSIDGQRTVYLIPSSSNNLSASIVTALTLTDLQDGLDAGVVLFDAEAFTINPRTQTLFTPIFSSATASFYKRGTFEKPISCSFEVYPSMSINQDFVPEYWMYFITHSCDPNIRVVAYNEAGNIVPSLPLNSYIGSPFTQSKQLLTSFTYTEPFTSASVNVDKLFSIIPEGKPGDESIVFEIVPSNVNLKSDSKGFVADFNSSITDIKLKQGSRYLIFTASREPGTFHIATGSIVGRNITPGNVYFDVNYTSSLIVSASSNMTDLSGSVDYPLEIQPYYTSSVYTASVFQQFTKVLDGPPPIEFIFSPQNVILQADEVGFVSDYAAGNTNIQVREGDNYLTFTTQSNSPGSWRILSVTTTNIQTGSLLSSSYDNATLTFNRFDYPYISASAVYNIRVNPFSLGPGHQYTSSIYTRTQSFSKNVAPPAARGVSLTTTAQTVTFDGDGVVLAPLGDITLTATAVNTTGSIFYQFYKDGSPYSSIQSDNFFDISSGDAVNPGEISTWMVEIRDGSSSPSAPVRAKSEITISGIKAGAEAYTVILTNENSSISADLWDVNFTGSNNTISAFKGTAQLIHTSSFSPETLDLQGNPIGSLGEYRVTIFSTSSFITPGSGLGSGSILNTVGSSAFIGDLGGWTTPGINQSGKIVYKIDIENGRQTFFKTQSFGVGIEAAAPYVVEVSNQNTSVVYKVSGQLTVTGTGTTIRAFRGGAELNNASSSFSTPQTDIYGNTGYKNQYRVTVNSVPAYIDLAGAIVSGSALLSNPAQIGNIDSWTSPNTNLTGEVVYRVELEGRETILKSQNFGVQLEGETGPGIVMRGQWNEVTNYIGSVETTNNRRDSVIYPDPSGSNGETHYFMALSGSGPATTSGPQLPPAPSNDTNYWQYLGQQDFFVSAKLAIFEESFVKNTINVGNNPGSSFANIVIAGGRTDPYLAIGQGGTQGATGTSGFSVTGSNILGYNQPGIFLGMYENGGAGTTGRFSIKSAGGTAGTRGLFWDGDVLTIIGSIRQTQPGVNEGGLRGVWSSGLIYYPDDIVTYQDQSWVMTGATHTSTNNSNASTGVPGSGPWTLAAAAGTSGTAGTGGAAAKLVQISSDSQVFTFDDPTDTTANDDTIRVYVKQQNLTSTITTANIGLYAADGNIITTPSLTGTVVGGSGEQYFDFTFSSNLSANKNKLPLLISASFDGVTDTTTIYKLEGGSDSSPFYFIRPLSGSQIKNKSGNLLLQVVKSDSNGEVDLGSGDYKIYSGSNLSTTISGITGTDYRPVIDATAIFGTSTFLLKDNIGNIYDSITVVDVTDGLGGGSFLSPSLNTSRKSGVTTYTPTFLSATASFFDVSGTEFTKAVRLIPTFSANVDNFYFENNAGPHNDSEIVLTLDDGDGTPFVGVGSGNMLPTKDVNITAVFTDPATGQSNTITETFYIVSDGADGVDAITVISTNQAHTVPASNAGVVSSYLGSGTTISVFEGTGSLSYDGVGTSAGSWKVSSSINPTSAITIGSITDTGDTATIADHSAMDNSEDVVTITYTILGKRFANTPFTASSAQSITKAKTGDDGTNGAAGTAGAAGSPGAGVVYRGEFAGTTGYFHTTTRRDVVRYAANYYLTANVGLNSSAGTTWGTPGASTSWESFGAQFSSVATDILLAQDVYADRTVNVGASGSSPVIQLYADYPTNANPAIKINLGTQGYSGTGGIFIGFDSATPKLSLVNSNNTKYVKWTGSDLEVKGTINADAGIIGGFAITQNAISSSNNKLILRDNGEITGSAIYLTSGSMASWKVDPKGLHFDGTTITGLTNAFSSTVTSSAGVVFPSSTLLQNQPTYNGGGPITSSFSYSSNGINYSNGYEIATRNSNTSITLQSQTVRIDDDVYLIYYHSESLSIPMGTTSGWNWVNNTTTLILDVDADMPVPPTDITYLSANGLWSTWSEITLQNVITGGNTEKFYPTSYTKATLTFAGITKNTYGIDVRPVNSGPLSITWFSATKLYSVGKVSAGYTYQTSGSIEIVRIASSGSAGQDKPYISMGQATQSYSEQGIYIGYDSSSGEYPVLSLVGGSGNFIQWDGQDLSLSGTVNAAAGNIGGFGIFSTAISSSQHITSGSVTPVTLPKLSLKANGEISGSEARFIRKIGNDFYTLIDTTNGILDATNLGRQIVSDYTEYERSNVDDNTTFFEAVSYPFVLLPNENKIGIACTISNYKNAATSNVSDVRFNLFYMVTGSTSNAGTSGLARYDFSEGGVILKTHTFSNAVGYLSRTIGPADGDGTYMFDIPSSMQGKYVVLQVLLKNNISAGSATGTYTRVKGISVNVGRAFSAASSLNETFLL